VRTKPDSGIPCDLLLLRGTCIVNEAMLSGESTPLLKESIELREDSDRLDMNGADRNSVLFSGTKALQVEKAGEGGMTSELAQILLDSTNVQLQTMDVLPLFCERVSVPLRVSSFEL
jgi:P-type E1-E2 ATPase